MVKEKRKVKITHLDRLDTNKFISKKKNERIHQKLNRSIREDINIPKDWRYYFNGRFKK